MSAASLRLRCCLLLFDDVDDLIGDAEVFDLRERRAVRHFLLKIASAISFQHEDISTHVVSAHIAFWQSEELIAFGARLHDFFEGEVHVGVALDEVAVECFAVLELDEHGVALRGGEKAER